MKTVDEMLNKILTHEGGFVDDPDDRGGATNYGVTQLTYSKWLGRPATLTEVKAMDIETAKEIYLKNYYFEPRIDALPNEVQVQLFDCSVNHGPVRAIKFAQMVCNLAGFGPVSVDGVNGPQTRKAITNAFTQMGDYFVSAVVDERVDFYHRIAANDSSQKKFIKGWLVRANSFRPHIEGLA